MREQLVQPLDLFILLGDLLVFLIDLLDLFLLLLCQLLLLGRILRGGQRCGIRCCTPANLVLFQVEINHHWVIVRLRSHGNLVVVRELLPIVREHHVVRSWRNRDGKELALLVGLQRVFSARLRVVHLHLGADHDVALVVGYLAGDLGKVLRGRERRKGH